MSLLASRRNMNSNNDKHGMKYGDFTTYYQGVSSAVLATSQAEAAACVGFQREESSGRGAPIHIQPETVLRQRRYELRQMLSSRSSDIAGVKTTTLFLSIDVH